MPRPPTIELIARGLLVVSNHVLLCRSRAKGYCYLPGGHVEFGESAPAALAREMLEETGQKVIVGDLLNVAEFTFKTKKRPHHELNLTFHMELTVPRGRSRGAGLGRAGSRVAGRTAKLAGERARTKGRTGGRAGDRAGEIGGLGGGRSGLPEVVSREEWLEFVWVGVGELTKLDVRPGPMAVWLAGEPWRSAASKGRGRVVMGSASWQGLE